MDNKEKILNAASDLLIEKGLQGLSVREISRNAGLSTIAIYSHFEGKQGLLDALYIEGFNQVQFRTEAAGDIRDPIEGSLAAGREYLNIAKEYEGHYRLIFGETGTNYQPSPKAVKASEQAFEALVNQISKLLPKGTKPVLQQKYAMRVWALLHGYVSLKHHIIGVTMDANLWERITMESLEKTLKDIQSDF